MAGTLDCKVALVTVIALINEEEFSLGEQMAARYGKDKVVHVTYPENFIVDEQKSIDTISSLAADKDIKIVVFPQAVQGTNGAVDKLKELRDDIFINFGLAQESIAESVKRANLMIRVNEAGTGPAMVRQAKKQGAKTFVHYSFPRHMAQPAFINRRDLISETCKSEGLVFVDVPSLDPNDANGIGGAQKFITDDVPKRVAEYGEDTAFFSTNCHMQVSLIKAVVDSHAIYPQPCCPSPFHGFPEALGIEGDINDLNSFIIEASRIVEEKNMSDRLSTWPVSTSTMFTVAGIEYALKWLKGEVPQNGIDGEVLKELMNDYIREALGEDGYILITPYSEDGITYDNFKSVLMGYLDF